MAVKSIADDSSKTKDELVGEIGELRCRVRDLELAESECRRAELALRQSKETIRALLNAPMDSSILLAKDGTILALNDIAAERLGKPADELVGASVYALFPPALAESRRARIEEVVRSGAPVRYEDEREERCFDSHLYPVSDADGKVNAVAIFARDVTERKKADQERRSLEGQVLHSQKLESLSVLAGGIAHDFNNLLTGILGHASLALMDLPQKSPLRKGISLIEKYAERAAELTRQMLAYSGRGSVDAQPLYLSRLVEGMVPLLKAAVPDKVVLDFQLAQNVPVIKADYAQLRQLVLGLVTNAGEAIADAEGTITVSVGAMHLDPDHDVRAYPIDEPLEGAYVFLEVRDTGCGIDEDTKAKIFDPFFTTKASGRGLGLAAALGIVRGHEGFFIVDSEPGKGTTFKVLLPCGHKRDARAEPERKLERGRMGGGTVLVIDDEEPVRTVTGQMLERAGFAVLTAEGGREGIRTFREHAADVAAVLLDMTMPDMNGEEVLLELRRARPDVRVILTSGYDEHDVSARFARKDSAGFIHKPYSPAKLVKKLRELLDT
ncbi:MAG: response regulator [Phycisphaerae bacterium]|nr:response regulator [Phycisphaerae bacterium]